MEKAAREVIAYNSRIASKLEEVAEILGQQGANQFRIGAYLRAAEMIRKLDRPLDEIVDERGLAGLDELPGIGQTLAGLLFQMVKTGRLPMLDRLRGSIDPLLTLSSVPGVGIKFAKMLHEELGIDSLQELEMATYDGRLAGIRGFGLKRIAGIRDSLAARLGRIPKDHGDTRSDEPPISEILDVDREYREKAASGTLHRIAPQRFNPSHEAWLPVLHTVRRGHHYTALFSNTARAHELGKTDDWVVVYYDTDHSQRQFTVVDAARGALAGKRIVRGRESECADHYTHETGSDPPPDHPETADRR